MKRRQLLWQLYPSYLIVIFVTLATSMWLSPLADQGSLGRLGLISVTLAIAALLAAFLARLLVDHVRRPLLDIRRGVEQFVRGELAGRLYISEPEEISALAGSLNRVGLQLEERLRIVERQRNELDAILSGMREGVMVLDGEHRFVQLNGAAQLLLGVDGKSVRGRATYEVIRNTALQAILAEAQVQEKPVEGSISLFDPEERLIDVYARKLPGGDEKQQSVLVVLDDVTHVRKLENLRRDFVANVSHELKTPITSIKGFVETLLDGALDDREEARRFLEIVLRQSERLSAIFDDLLSLSRVEQSSEVGDLEFETHPLGEVLDSALAPFRRAAEQKQIQISVEGVDIPLRMNRNLIEQAVGNLVDNAIKMSESDTQIAVTSKVLDGFAVIRVTDQGPGIPRDHLPRIFERFYRVDKGRSRKAGGTGLGLSIVKHIAQAHGGRVEVESILGFGSAFTLFLPCQPDVSPS